MISESPGTIAQGVFAWLLDESGIGIENGTEPIAPDTLSWYVRTLQLTDSESYGIYLYACLVGKLDPSKSERVLAVGRALDLNRETLAFCHHVSSELLDKYPMCTGVDALLHETPARVESGVTQAVADLCRENRPPRRRLEDLSSIAFEHPADRATKAVLESIPGFGTLMGKIVDVQKRELEIFLYSHGIRVTANSLPDLYEVYEQACDTLCIACPPPLYVGQDLTIGQNSLNAYTVGVEEPYVYITPLAASLFDREELLYLVGHELGHVMAGHVKYLTIANVLVSLGQSTLPFSGVAKLVADLTALPVLLLWCRRSEFTADRAGLLSCQSPEAAFRAIMKMAGYPPIFYDRMRTKPYLRQALDFEERVSTSYVDYLFDMKHQLYASHPRTVERSAELQKWIADGSFEDLVEADARQRKSIAETITRDPYLQQTLVLLRQVLTSWASEEFHLPRQVVSRLLRGAFVSSATLRGTLLDRLLRVELVVTKESPDSVKYEVAVLFNRNERPVRALLELPLPCAWDQVPGEYRRQFIKSGQNELIFLVYSV